MGLGDQVHLKSYLEKLWVFSNTPSKPLKTILKLETSQRFGGKKGGCLSSEVINKLRNVSITVVESTNYNTIKNPY
jgi:hypothetical protein